MASILVVEDYCDNRNVVELILRDAQYEVHSAADGNIGVGLAMLVRPDLILMDLAMPNMDGWEATRRLKANSATRDIPVIAFTAQMDSESLERAIAVGCVAVIEKPFEIDTLIGRINACLSAGNTYVSHAA